MDSLFSAFHAIVVMGGTIVSSVLPLTTHPARLLPHPVITPTVAAKSITIQKTVDAMGKEVTVQLFMPKNGGAIDGTISGDCQGTIDGTYAGQPQDTFNGKGQVTCTIGFFSLPADTTFTGKVHPEQQTADIHYTITSGSNFSKTGDVTVSYTE